MPTSKGAASNSLNNSMSTKSLQFLVEGRNFRDPLFYWERGNGNHENGSGLVMLVDLHWQLSQILDEQRKSGYLRGCGDPPSIF
ncbi:MAG: hypothetical protein NPIRA03_32910 [Nitrospirales bacterium]|nr:MAG: hypothetical protein NPIRA03_32910 [Nitrospirales bacterium]